MKFLGLNIQYHRMPKYLRGFKTTAPSHIRIFFRGKFVMDIPVPKYGSQP